MNELEQDVRIPQVALKRYITAVFSLVANVKCMVSGGFIPQTYQTAQK